MSIDKIMNLGDDAMSSRFQLVFPIGIPGGGDDESIALRMDQGFDPPDTQIGTYDIMYRGTKITKTAMMDETDKTFSIDVRLDTNWKIFDDLNTWLALSFDVNNGTAQTDLITRVPLTIEALGLDSNVVKRHHYKGTKLKGIKIGNMDPTSNEPIRLTLTFVYLTYSTE